MRNIAVSQTIKPQVQQLDSPSFPKLPKLATATKEKNTIQRGQLLPKLKFHKPGSSSNLLNLASEQTLAQTHNNINKRSISDMSDFTPTSRILRSKQAKNIIFKQSASLLKPSPSKSEFKQLPADSSNLSTVDVNIIQQQGPMFNFTPSGFSNASSLLRSRSNMRSNKIVQPSS